MKSTFFAVFVWNAFLKYLRHFWQLTIPKCHKLHDHYPSQQFSIQQCKIEEVMPLSSQAFNKIHTCHAQICQLSLTRGRTNKARLVPSIYWLSPMTFRRHSFLPIQHAHAPPEFSSMIQSEFLPLARSRQRKKMGGAPQS